MCPHWHYLHPFAHHLPIYYAQTCFLMQKHHLLQKKKKYNHNMPRWSKETLRNHVPICGCAENAISHSLGGRFHQTVVASSNSLSLDENGVRCIIPSTQPDEPQQRSNSLRRSSGSSRLKATKLALSPEASMTQFFLLTGLTGLWSKVQPRRMQQQLQATTLSSELRLPTKKWFLDCHSKTPQ